MNDVLNHIKIQQITVKIKKYLDKLYIIWVILTKTVNS